RSRRSSLPPSAPLPPSRPDRKQALEALAQAVIDVVYQAMTTPTEAPMTTMTHSSSTVRGRGLLRHAGSNRGSSEERARSQARGRAVECRADARGAVEAGLPPVRDSGDGSSNWLASRCQSGKGTSQDRKQTQAGPAALLGDLKRAA